MENMAYICRFCLCKDNTDLKSVLDEINGVNIIEITANCVGIMITPEDEYSKYMCEYCLKQLMACNTFRNQCLQSMENYDKSKLEFKIEISEQTSINWPDLELNDVKSGETINCQASVAKEKAKTVNLESNLGKKCPHCSEWRVNLRKHIKNDHSNLTITKPKKEKTNEPKQKRICYICGLSVTGLYNHLISHNIDGVEFNCDYCGKGFKSKYLLIAHFKIHLNKREYKCTFCPKAFNHEKSLKDHMCHHTGEKNYECQICHRRFAQASSLSKHLPSHLKIYKFPCTICGKKFTRNSGRKKHEKSHSDDHPYRCTYCPKTFKACSSYSVHMTKHFKDNPLKCDICDDRFYRLSDYKTHKRQHEYNII